MMDKKLLSLDKKLKQAGIRSFRRRLLFYLWVEASVSLYDYKDFRHFYRIAGAIDLLPPEVSNLPEGIRSLKEILLAKDLKAEGPSKTWIRKAMHDLAKIVEKKKDKFIEILDWMSNELETGEIFKQYLLEGKLPLPRGKRYKNRKMQS